MMAILHLISLQVICYIWLIYLYSLFTKHKYFLLVEILYNHLVETSLFPGETYASTGGNTGLLSGGNYTIYWLKLYFLSDGDDVV